MACPFILIGFLKTLMPTNFVQFQGRDNEIFSVFSGFDAAHRGTPPVRPTKASKLKTVLFFFLPRRRNPPNPAEEMITSSL